MTQRRTGSHDLTIALELEWRLNGTVQELSDAKATFATVHPITHSALPHSGGLDGNVAGGKNRAPHLLLSPTAFYRQFTASLVFGLTGPAVGPEDLFSTSQGRGGGVGYCLPDARAFHTSV